MRIAYLSITTDDVPGRPRLNKPVVGDLTG
jgi:hypothetical protein